MSEELFVRHCSPTLAALKTGNLFSCKVQNMDLLRAEIKSMNNMLNSKGVHICLLMVKNDRALVYVFRPSRLKNDLENKDARALLENAGYTGESLYDNVRHLSERIEKCSEFPHEIGLFLGYPVEDIKGFIENKGKNFKCSGYWKVYCNEHEAIKIFKKFKKCTEVYCRKFNEGLSIMRLTIAA